MAYADTFLQYVSGGFYTGFSSWPGYGLCGHLPPVRLRRLLHRFQLLAWVWLMRTPSSSTSPAASTQVSAIGLGMAFADTFLQYVSGGFYTGFSAWPGYGLCGHLSPFSSTSPAASTQVSALGLGMAHADTFP